MPGGKPPSIPGGGPPLASMPGGSPAGGGKAAGIDAGDCSAGLFMLLCLEEGDGVCMFCGEESGELRGDGEWGDNMGHEDNGEVMGLGDGNDRAAGEL